MLVALFQRDELSWQLRLSLGVAREEKYSTLGWGQRVLVDLVQSDTRVYYRALIMRSTHTRIEEQLIWKP